MATLDGVEERIHVRYDGRTYDYPVRDLDVADEPTNAQILEAASHSLSDELGRNVSLDGFVVESYSENGLWDVHPQAKFGFQ